MKYRYLLCLLPCALCLVFSGCGGTLRPDGMPVLYPCEITITQDSKPLENAAVMLLPENGTQWNASGSTDSSGKTSVRTLGQYAGAAAGNYKVIVTKQLTEKVSRSIGGKPAEIEIVYDLVDSSFMNAAATPLKVNVAAKSGNAFSLDAGKSVKNLIPER